jgi:hypothetical protein
MKLNKQSGQVLVGTAVAMVVLAGFAGLAIDMGTLRYQKRLQQTGADAAAIAGASELNALNGSTSWLPAAQAASNQNGFNDTSDSLSACTPTAAVGTTCVFVQNPPADVTFNGTTILGGKHSGDPNYVETLVAKVQPTYFMTLLGFNSQVIVARAVATNTGGGGAGGGGCIYTLGTPTKNASIDQAAMGVPGNAVLNAPTCGIVDNGNLIVNGSVQVVGGSISYGGAYSPPAQQSPCTPGALPTQGICPTPVKSPTYSGDPFSGLYPAAPTLGAGSSSTDANGVTTYTPGSYNNITINSTDKVIFQPGVYTIDGNFKINGGASVCGGGVATFGAGTMTCTQDGAGDGASFYMTGNNSTFTTNGSDTVEMYAPNSGTYEGLLFYQSPSNNDATFNGTGASFFQGALYAPDAKIRMGGNAGFNSGALYTVIVSDQYEVFGGPIVNLASNYSGLTNGGGPLKGLTQWAVLVE